MPYDKNDPRSQLSTAGTAPTGIPRPAQYRELHKTGPDEKHGNGSVTWWTRSQAMLIGWTEAQPGDELVSEATGEHAVLVFDGATLQVSHDGEVASVDEPAVVIVPPGSSSLRITSAGTVIRVIAAATAPELAGRCANKREYEAGRRQRRGVRSVARPSRTGTAFVSIRSPTTRSPRDGWGASSGARR